MLVIAPHEDDETLGAGCSIYEHRRAGDEVRVVILTDGSFLKFGELEPAARALMSPHWDRFTEWYVQLRESESLRALAILGVEEKMVSFLGFPDTRLSHYVPECTEKLFGILNERRFDIVYVPSDSDAHKDHRAANKASLEALRRRYPMTATDLAVIRRYTVYEPEANSKPPRGLVVKRVFSEEAKERKTTALRVYRSQYSHLFHRFETNEEEFVELESWQ